ncbi:hypothetical protein FA09DRAFT_358563 [Tilletiopsis washingtonensis]|uniref:Uncharacterized protein n=1 Tax=Tilletiopsis washingtonensis TaxID=58919 RepID=A0A316ZGW4_9BASI|nr:hypothetical protein FA09DRAFT_358563 [Tilletiopsis washingtonensis]PWO00497.1 hypothetical protein FA09DRAFT_358563 [Tilletiopsis washingtonensis]
MPRFLVDPHLARLPAEGATSLAPAPASRTSPSRARSSLSTTRRAACSSPSRRAAGAAAAASPSRPRNRLLMRTSPPPAPLFARSAAPQPPALPARSEASADVPALRTLRPLRTAAAAATPHPSDSTIITSSPAGGGASRAASTSSLRSALAADAALSAARVQQREAQTHERIERRTRVGRRVREALEKSGPSVASRPPPLPADEPEATGRHSVPSSEASSTEYSDDMRTGTTQLPADALFPFHAFDETQAHLHASHDDDDDDDDASDESAAAVAELSRHDVAAPTAEAKLATPSLRRLVPGARRVLAFETPNTPAAAPAAAAAVAAAASVLPQAALAIDSPLPRTVAQERVLAFETPAGEARGRMGVPLVAAEESPAASTLARRRRSSGAAPTVPAAAAASTATTSLEAQVFLPARPCLFHRAPPSRAAILADLDGSRPRTTAPAVAVAPFSAAWRRANSTAARSSGMRHVQPRLWRGWKDMQTYFVTPPSYTYHAAAPSRAAMQEWLAAAAAAAALESSDSGSSRLSRGVARGAAARSSAPSAVRMPRFGLSTLELEEAAEAADEVSSLRVGIPRSRRRSHRGAASASTSTSTSAVELEPRAEEESQWPMPDLGSPASTSWAAGAAAAAAHCFTRQGAAAARLGSARAGASTTTAQQQQPDSLFDSRASVPWDDASVWER